MAVVTCGPTPARTIASRYLIVSGQAAAARVVATAAAADHAMTVSVVVASHQSIVTYRPAANYRA